MSEFMNMRKAEWFDDVAEVLADNYGMNKTALIHMLLRREYERITGDVSLPAVKARKPADKAASFQFKQ